MDTFEIVFDFLCKNAHIKHYPPSNKLWISDKWSWLIPKKREFNEILRKYLYEGYNIKTGWTGTSIRGYRDYVIFISEPYGNKRYKWDIDNIKTKLNKLNELYF